MDFVCSSTQLGGNLITVYNRYLKKLNFFNFSLITPSIIPERKFFFFMRFDRIFLCSQLLDLFAVDLLGSSSEKRFRLSYLFLSFRRKYRLFVKSFLKFKEKVFSIMSWYEPANWLEREVWDMFGIFFYVHSDLRRILTDYGFEGYPLRKDFPVTGFFEIRYSGLIQRIVSEPIRLTQEYRTFRFINPWS